MKRLILFSVKNKKNINVINLSSAEFADSTVSVKAPLHCRKPCSSKFWF